jgi:hypothetical protein
MLLLEDLIKNTWTEHTDYGDLCKAKAKIGAVLNMMNDQKKKAEEMNMVSYVYSLISGLLDSGVIFVILTNFQFQMVSVSRKFAKEGKMTEVEPRGGQQEFQIFLFNDLVIWTKPKVATKSGERGRTESLSSIQVPAHLLTQKIGTAAQAPKPVYDFFKLKYLNDLELVEQGSSSTTIFFVNINQLGDRISINLKIDGENYLYYAQNDTETTAWLDQFTNLWVSATKERRQTFRGKAPRISSNNTSMFLKKDISFRKAMLSKSSAIDLEDLDDAETTTFDLTIVHFQSISNLQFSVSFRRSLRGKKLLRFQVQK